MMKVTLAKTRNMQRDVATMRKAVSEKRLSENRASTADSMTNLLVRGDSPKDDLDELASTFATDSAWRASKCLKSLSNSVKACNELLTQGEIEFA